MSMKTNNKKMNLCGDWKFTYAEDGKLDENRVVGGEGLLQWLDCKVPGNAQLDLLSHGIIEDPYYGTNNEKIRKYEYYEWWYAKRFSIPDEMVGKRLELLFHGLDTFAKIWLNGKLIGNTDNMFIHHSFDVSGLVRYKEENELIIKFSPPLFATLGKELSGCYASFGAFESLWARKARHSYGWDIAPRLITSGIWREVELVAHDDYEIKDVFARVAELSDRNAKLVFHVVLDLPRKSWENLKVSIHGRCKDSTFRGEFPVGSVRTEAVIDIEDAYLWWPLGAGEPYLYDMEYVLLKDDEPVHVATDRIGIRTVELNQKESAVGYRNFTVMINNTPIFCKGTNSVPLDAFHCRDLERTPKFVELVRDTNCNMVRIWGGGVYEHDRFYDLCDENGIMVLQDFMYACAIYPQSLEFQQVVEKEAITVLKHLRNHPSIVIWCGDNENDMAYSECYDQSQSPENNVLTRRVLKDVCQIYDGTRPYVPSSPYSPTPGCWYNSENEGDRHLYRHGEFYKSETYLKDNGRFYSEIGHLALTNTDSIKKFIPGEDLWPIGEKVWNHHGGELQLPYNYMDRLERIFRSIRNVFGNLPDNLDNLVQTSQIVQAEALKFWIERCRQRKFECSGILWWNMIDCWPAFSDSVVDYYYEKKLAYEYVKCSQADVLTSLGEEDEKGNPIILINDLLRPVQCKCLISLFDYSGTLLQEYEIKDIDIDENSKVNIGHVDFKKMGTKNGENNAMIACMKVISRDAGTFCNHYLYYDRPWQMDIYDGMYQTFKNWTMEAES